LKRLNADPEFQAKRLEQLKRLNADPEFQAKRLERLKKNKGRARPEGAGRPNVPIEVLDSITNEATVYPSISECARALGMDESSIRKTFKRSSACGETSN
jgi:hypothetical protein